MSAISDYLEKKLLNFLFRSGTFDKPTNISIALLNSVPKDNDTGATMDEVPSTRTNDAGAEVSTQYARVSLGDPSENGNLNWSEVGLDQNSAYFVYTGQVENSGYFYPLYLDSNKAVSAGNGSFTTYGFEEFPGVEFFKPDNVGAVNSPINPDPTEIIYRLYDGNGFIQNYSNITFDQAGKGGWGTIKAVALMDSSEYNTGEILMYAPLEVEKSIGEGDVVQFIPTQLEISLK
jgi:hypothetical protein